MEEQKDYQGDIQGNQAEASVKQEEIMNEDETPESTVVEEPPKKKLREDNQLRNNWML